VVSCRKYSTVFILEHGQSREILSRGLYHIDAPLQKSAPARRASISIRELSIPKEARPGYEDAQKALGRRDVSSAVAHLKGALDPEPQFSAAWNHLGTIAYQAGQYVEAEADFRKGLEADPDTYAPSVNLGGVLINIAKWDEALEYNRQAVLANPNDALANSQLGTAYF
jgi:tetratricopeptide (TPR) repeat protein